MPDKTVVDVGSTLDDLHQVTEVAELDTSGLDRGPLGQVHPIGWSALALLALAVVFRLRDTEWLIGNFDWWHWAGLVGIVALSARPGPIKAVSKSIDSFTDFFEHGSNVFERPWAGFIGLLSALVVAGLCIGPLRGLADWIVGLEITDIGGGDFEVVSNASAGWIRSIVAAVVLVVGIVAITRIAARFVPEGEISVRSAALMALATFAVTAVVVGLASNWSNGITTAFALAILIAGAAIGPLWTIGWGIFATVFSYVVTRYTARFIEADIIIGEVNSLGLQLFGLLALLGLAYGVKAGVNPRIDFWWAEFTNRRKALLDFVLHALLFVPFLWAALRLLHSYAKTNLGFKPDFSGKADGSWPASWHVWETWKQSSDAGNLPVGPVRAMIFVGFVMFLSQILSEMIKAGFVLIRREDLAELKVVDAPTRIE